MSTITRAELPAGHATDDRRVRALVAPMVELAVDAPIAERAGRIRRTTGTRLADAVIAATALEHGLTLVTRNLRDLAAVRGLRLRAPGDE